MFAGSRARGPCDLAPRGLRAPANLTVRELRATLCRMLPKLRAAALAAGLLGLLALSACSVNQTLVIAENDSGTFVMHAEVSTLLRDYLGSLSELSGSASPGKEGRVFDAAAIRKDFQSRPGIVVRTAATPTPTSLDLDLGFDSL